LNSILNSREPAVHWNSIGATGGTLQKGQLHAGPGAFRLSGKGAHTRLWISQIWCSTSAAMGDNISGRAPNGWATWRVSTRQDEWIGGPLSMNPRGPARRG